MEIKVCTTHEWTDRDWSSYVISFNDVFDKEYSMEYFEHKYLSSCDSCSYHSLLLNELGEVVGSCSVIPYYYTHLSTDLKTGLAVDVFIKESYRTDPLMLRRMYKKLTKLLIERSVVAVMAVPNATAYPYWKNVVKWKDVGAIRYWAIPVRAGNIIHKTVFVNIFSRIYCLLTLGVSVVLSSFGGKQRKFSYAIVESEEFLQERFGKEYCFVEHGNIQNYFRIIDENGVKTAYLIYSRDRGTLSFKSLCRGVLHILKYHEVDLILYVGPLSFFQTLFLKLPRRFEPKLLPLTCDLLSPDDSAVYGDIFDFSNWDFGLLNYDVR